MPMLQAAPPETQRDQDSFQNESNKLYLKDMKNFMRLRKAAHNSNNRRYTENQRVLDQNRQMQMGAQAMLLAQTKGVKK